MVITKREDVTNQVFCKILRRKFRLRGSLLSILIQYFFGWWEEAGGRLFEFEWEWEGGRVGWGGCLFEAGRLETFLPSGWALIRDGR